MVRTVRTFLPVVGEPTALVRAFEGDPARWLPGSRHTGPDRYVVTLRAGSLSQQVTTSIGSAWRSEATRWRSISWEPVAEDGSSRVSERFLPSLDGEVGLHVEPGGRVTLVFDGRYLPPGGAVGSAIDAAGLGRIADATIHRLTSDITARLSAEATLLGASPHRDTPLENRPTPVRT